MCAPIKHAITHALPQLIIRIALIKHAVWLLHKDPLKFPIWKRPSQNAQIRIKNKTKGLRLNLLFEGVDDDTCLAHIYHSRLGLEGPSCIWFEREAVHWSCDGPKCPRSN